MEYILILLAIVFYFIPTFVGNGKRNIDAIFTLNLLLGWSVIGWIVALVWATTAEPPVPIRSSKADSVKALALPKKSISEELESLQRMKDAGHLTHDEHQMAKNKVLAHFGKD